jgi:hypothetical protein
VPRADDIITEHVEVEEHAILCHRAHLPFAIAALLMHTSSATPLNDLTLRAQCTVLSQGYESIDNSPFINAAI